jgi:hypothetical protein
MHSPLTREHRSMTSSVVRIVLARRRAVAVLALAAVTLVAVVACAIGAANAATRRQDGFGAAARVAAARAATRLGPAQPRLPSGQKGHAAK